MPTLMQMPDHCLSYKLPQLFDSGELNITNSSSAELAQKMVKVNGLICQTIDV